ASQAEHAEATEPAQRPNNSGSPTDPGRIRCSEAPTWWRGIYRQEPRRVRCVQEESCKKSLQGLFTAVRCCIPSGKVLFWRVLPQISEAQSRRQFQKLDGPKIWQADDH